MFALNIFLCFIIVFHNSSGESVYSVPNIKVEGLKTGALRVSMEDSPGVKFVEFHANLNKPIKENEIGEIFNRITTTRNGYWMFINTDDVSLKEGDKLYYWVRVYNDGKYYNRIDQEQTIEDLVE